MYQLHIAKQFLVLGALLLCGAQPALGKPGGQAPEWVTSGLRAGTAVAVDQLGSYLANNLLIGSARGSQAAPRGWAFSLRVELISRDNAVLATYDTQTAEAKPGTNHAAAIWIAQPDALNGALAAPVRPAEFARFRTDTFIVKGIGPKIFPDVCLDSSHAVLVTMAPGGNQFAGSSGTGKTMALCLTGER